jgi:hypothetical protein
MKIRNTDKREYSAPLIELIKLDNEISLALESTPPPAPGEVKLNIPEYFNNNPFKANLA